MHTVLNSAYIYIHTYIKFISSLYRVQSILLNSPLSENFKLLSRLLDMNCPLFFI